MEVIVKENYKQLNIGECLKTIEWENIPHVAQILEVIYKNPRIQHARLAEMIDISSATLTGIMKRMTDAGMVEFIRSGKFKYLLCFLEAELQQAFSLKLMPAILPID